MVPFPPRKLSYPWWELSSEAQFKGFWLHSKTILTDKWGVNANCQQHSKKLREPGIRTFSLTIKSRKKFWSIM